MKCHRPACADPATLTLSWGTTQEQQAACCMAHAKGLWDELAVRWPHVVDRIVITELPHEVTECSRS